MNNSLILTALGRFFATLGKKFRESGVRGLFERIYMFVSRAWTGSIFAGALRHDSGVRCERSLIYRLCFLPFALLEKLNERWSEKLSAAMSESVFLALGRTYMQNCFALNTRFLGVWLIAAGVGRTLMYPFAGISRLMLAAAALGAVLMIGNFNIMRIINSSAVVRFCKSAVGFSELDLLFFDEKETVRTSRLVMAAAVGLVSGVIMPVNALYGFAVPVALGGMAAVLYQPIVGVFAAAVAAPFAPTMVLAGLCLFTGMSLILRSVYTKGFKWRLDGVGMGLIVLLVILLVSSLFSFAPAGSLKVWAMYLVFVGFYFVVTNSVEGNKVLFSLMRVFVLFGALVALYGVMQYVFGWTTNNAWIDEEMFEDATMRVYSTMGNPNVLGEYLLVAMPLAALFMIQDDRKKLSKYVYAAVFAVMALCLVLTQSRGCWLGFLLAAAVFVTFRKGRLWGLAPIAIAALLFVIPKSMIERLMSIGDMSDTSTSYRVFIWMGTLDMMRSFWLGGIGMGEAAFKCVYPMYSYNAIVAPHSHNTFLQLWVEGGIACLGAFVVTMAVFVKKLASFFGALDKKSTEATAALAIASGTLGFLLQSMFDYTFYNYRMMAMFFMFVAYGVCLYSGRRSGE